LRLETREAVLTGWNNIVSTLKNPARHVSIGIVGKYVDLKESYKSLNEAIVHGGIANNTKVEVAWVDSETLNEGNVEAALNNVDGILVPGGFGERGSEGKMVAIRFAREKKIPFFGICFGMQLAAIEFARHVCGIRDATSREFANIRKSRNFVIDIMEEQRKLKDKGGTMRLGSYPCSLKEGSKAKSLYGADITTERHRHRYEFNNQYRSLFQKHGMALSGICKDRDLVEIIELEKHPWFVGVQFHPEFRSRPLAPHPLFRSFVEACLANHKSVKLNGRKVARSGTNPRQGKQAKESVRLSSTPRTARSAKRRQSLM
jgi:CTP synthase